MMHLWWYADMMHLFNLQENVLPKVPLVLRNQVEKYVTTPNKTFVI